MSDSARAVDEVRLSGRIPIDVGDIVPVEKHVVEVGAEATCEHIPDNGDPSLLLKVRS